MFEYVNYPKFHRDFITSCISYNSVIHEYQTRTNSSLSVVIFNRTASQSPYAYQSIKNWNIFQRISKIKLDQPISEPNLKFTFALKLKVFLSYVISLIYKLFFILFLSSSSQLIDQS